MTIKFVRFLLLCGILSPAQFLCRRKLSPFGKQLMASQWVAIERAHLLANVPMSVKNSRMALAFLALDRLELEQCMRKNSRRK